MSKFSKQLQVLVSYEFDESTLIDALQTIFAIQNVVVEDIVVYDSKSRKGDSYMSTISRFTVKASGRDKSTDELKNIVLPVITKFLPNNIGRIATFRIWDFFRNEVIFYNTVWKALNDFQISKTPCGVFTELPLCISAFADGKNDYIILEDLSSKGYTSLDRSCIFDLKHTQLILKLFAKFHAVSLAFKSQHPDAFERVANSLEDIYVCEKWRSWNEAFQKKSILTVVRDAVEKQLSPFYLNRINELFAHDFYGLLTKCCSTKGPLSVITHGDAWIPNFLLKYDEDKDVPISGIMLDFQLSRYSSSVNDIAMFLYSCTDQSSRLKYWDALIEGYHTAVVQALEKLGSSPDLLTLEALKTEMKMKGIFGVYMGLESIIMSLLEDDETIELDMIQERLPLETVWIVNPFKSEDKRQRVADVIKHAIDNDYM